MLLYSYRREALYTWKQRLGSEATYRRLINVFEQADFQNCAEIIRSIICEDESEEDDSSDYDEPIPQPATYPNVQSNPRPSPKLSRCVSSCDEYVLINPATANNLPKGQVHDQKVLESHDVSVHVVPMLSSKHKSTAATPIPQSKTEKPPNYPICIGLYDYSARESQDLSFMKGDLMYIIDHKDYERWYARKKDGGEEGYIPSNHVTEYRSRLHAEEWFSGRIKREDAEKQLMSSLNSHGSYLIRESESTPGGYSLSVRDVDLVQHYKVFQSVNQEFYITTHCMFKTLQDLVAHHRRQADGLCVNLRKPCVIAPIDISGQVIDEWQTDRSKIRLFRKLISGEFTEVWGGMWNDTTPIAVKTLKPNQNMTIDDFLQSANLMKKLQHPKLVHLYARCSKEEPIYIITELMEHGSLLHYLVMHGEGRSLKLPQLIDMAAQVVAGMAYLEEKNIIHRDLAARNIQVGKGVLCKVANFELARVMDKDIYEGQKGEKIAIKWAAPEALLHNKFCIKSDVWSFGIVLYEVITYGSKPYPDMTDAEVEQQIRQGYHMPQPMGCPGKLYDIMLNCWRVEPANRPTFETLQRKRALLINTSVKEQWILPKRL